MRAELGCRLRSNVPASQRRQRLAAVPQVSARRRCNQHVRKRCALHAVKAADVQRSLDLLHIVQVRGLVELKQAYYERIRELHPDVNQDRDTTSEAAAVNAAYETLCEVCRVTPHCQ